jgi:hypothetical protein
MTSLSRRNLIAAGAAALAAGPALARQTGHEHHGVHCDADAAPRPGRGGGGVRTVAFTLAA